ncbi:MAG: GatB/YqeY domain-containing protein [Deltaproteobacteria bacterium]|nr:GatB/YqeY domain-containing protein [Deltaproteobacteria bacterium]
MTYREEIDRQMVVAAKAKDKIVLSALRMMKTALHNREIDLKRELNDTEFLQVLSSMAKQRKDSIDQFKAGNRLDLVEKEEAELKIIEGFLPQQISPEEMAQEIENTIKEVGASSVKEMGKVMKILMPKLTGRVDGKVLSEMVKARLSSGSFDVQ